MKISFSKPLTRNLLFAGLFLTSAAAQAEKIINPVAEFAGLDKITGRIISFDVYMDETVQFGALQVTPRVCNSRPPTETPQTTGFIEVDEVTLENEVQSIFSGWMFAASPALHAVEHSIYDVWLTDCKTTTAVAPPENYSGPPVEVKEPEKDPPAETPTDTGTPEGPGVAGDNIAIIPRPKPSFL
ncbi:MAG: DUF2155 domain-containing protein [Stappiaceae bacterium]